MASEMIDTIDVRQGASGESAPSWYALWTRSNYERVVNDQLRAKGFETFLPEMSVLPTRRRVRRVECRPLFPGYLFLHRAMDKESYIEVIKARGLVRILGDGWNRLSIVPPAEVEAVRRVVESQLHPTPFPFLEEGRRVRVRCGPLAGVEGILLERKDDRALLVVQVDLFRRSVAVEIDSTFAEPA